MPVHDWTRVDAGLFHAFHQSWIIRLCDALNGERLPPDYFALAEQSIREPIPDVLTLELSPRGGSPGQTATALAVSSAPPSTSRVFRAEDRIYVHKTSRIVVRHRHGRVVAVVEIVSPGNKASRNELRFYLEKASERSC